MLVVFCASIPNSSQLLLPQLSSYLSIPSVVHIWSIVCYPTHTDYSGGYFRQNDNDSLFIKREQSAAYCVVNKDGRGGEQDRDGKSNHFDGPVVNRQFIKLTNIILQGRNGASKYTLQPGMGISGG